MTNLKGANELENAKNRFGTEGGTRTHTVSPPPDFESGASTNSATPAQAAIITKMGYETMGELKLFTMLVYHFHLVKNSIICNGAIAFLFEME